MRFYFRLPVNTVYIGKRVVLATTVAAVAQGVWYRHKYECLPSQPLPTIMKGAEMWLDKVRNVGQDLKDSLQDKLTLRRTIHDMIEFRIRKLKSLLSFENILNNKIPAQVPNRKLKLLILGDSLVRGVGCDNAEGTSPVLASVLAKILSFTWKMDVQWRAEGLIGATVTDMREKFLPIVKEDFNSPDSENTEYIIVLICGLNDWKTLLTEFPWGSGPTTFRNDLSNLVAEIQSLRGDRPCRVYLPALPMTCGEKDPNCILQRMPLKLFIDAICWMWDLQKKRVADNQIDTESVTFIDMPVLDTAYATPGSGNVCDDGVHPSTQGYIWWATHIAEAIIQSNLVVQKKL